MKKLFLTISGVFGAVPGAAILLRGLLVPPGRKLLFGGVVEAFGALALLILWTNKKSLMRLSSTKATKLSIFFGVLFFIFLAIFILTNSLCIIQHETRGTVYYPLWTGSELARMIKNAGGRYPAIDKYGIDDIIKKTHSPEINLILTDIILIFMYQAVFSSLTISFGILGFRQKNEI